MSLKIKAAFGFVLAFIFFHIPFELAKDAVTGWVNDQIASWFGLTSPSIPAVIEVAWSYGVPAVAALFVLLLYHALQGRYRAASSSTKIGKAEPIPALLRAEPSQKVDTEVEQIRRSIGWLAEQLTSYEPYDNIKEDAVARYSRIKDSDHTIWLDRHAAQLRRDFLNRCGIAMSDGKRFDTAQESREIRASIATFARQLDEKITRSTGQRTWIPQPDMKLSDFVRDRLGIASFTAPDPEGRIGRFLFDVRQKALLQMITVWGRPDSDEGWDDLQIIPLSEIAGDYWKNFKINEYEFKIKGRSVTTPDGNEYDKTYSDLHISREQVETVWPTQIFL
jgi:hypothetical protein